MTISSLLTQQQNFGLSHFCSSTKNMHLIETCRIHLCSHLFREFFWVSEMNIQK